MRVGVLALQGAFIEHERRIAELGATPFEIRTRADVENPFDGLILPGGESTVQGKLLHELDLFDPLRRMIGAGLPVFGTCAGLILLARRIQDDPLVHFGLLDVVVERNAYGRQLGSFHAEGPFADGVSIPMSFIRAPAIREVGSGVDILASENGIPVAVRQGNILATAFHPELDPDTTVHSHFLSMVEEFVVS
ncbi:MAG: pyridoxal 5'-phosphate synthase glutaminase subunit PdxT [bacterium]|nr:pyridoxal 5'-phosphate synthase glutaminase subunit PdxT [bacterium]